MRKVLRSGEYIVSPDAWDYRTYLSHRPLVRRREGNPGRKGKNAIVQCTAAFDIETSHVGHGQASMYVWMLQLDEDTPTIVGRTWPEFLRVLETMHDLLAGRKRTLVIWVHNLSYEFQFLRTIYNFDASEVFAVQKRKVLRLTMYGGAIEFRCSYLHSNMSLELYTAKMGAKHGKESGEAFDYTKRRYPWTNLTDEELKYCVHDVLGLVEALNIEMAHDGDTLDTIPLTSTGYVRRDAKRAMRAVPHDWLRSLQPDYPLYRLLSEAFRGGNTHANRWYSGQVLEDVRSMDESSAYPAAMLTRRFPVTPFIHLGACDGRRLLDLVTRREKAVIARVAFHGLRLRDETWGCPYISIAKTRHGLKVDADNGRVLSADYLEMTVTDIDLRIIAGEYDFEDVVCEDAYHANYGYLPQPLMALIQDYFERKTTLKGVDGQEIYYTKSKNKLNSIYGMSAQDPVKQDVIFNGLDFEDADEDEAAILAENARKSFFPYQWGVWTTANAREMLEEGLRVVGEHFVYADTDSIKYLAETDEIRDGIARLNAERERLAKEGGACATDPAGNTHYMGVFEDEGVYSRFVTLGAKKYAYEQGGRLNVTVAGVSKRPVTLPDGSKMPAGAYELERAGGLERFRPGFTFTLAGGTESVYNDEPYGVMQFSGGSVYVGPNVLIRDSTYTLGLAAEYERLLERVYRVKLAGSQSPEDGATNGNGNRKANQR